MSIVAPSTNFIRKHAYIGKNNNTLPKSMFQGANEGNEKKMLMQMVDRKKKGKICPLKTMWCPFDYDHKAVDDDEDD